MPKHETKHSRRRVHRTPPPTRRRSSAPVVRRAALPGTAPRPGALRAATPTLQQHYPLAGPIQRARALVRNVQAAGATVAARAVWDRLTGVLASGKLPDPPPRKLGVVESSFQDLEPRAPGDTLAYAPSAVSDSQNRYARMLGTDRVFRIGFKAPWLHIGTATGSLPTTYPVGALIGVGNVTGSGPAVRNAWNVKAINPLRLAGYFQTGETAFQEGISFPDWLGAADVALGFSMWRFTGPLVFHYEPQSSSASAVRLDFAYTEDAAHPSLGLNNNGAIAPNLATISSTPYSVAFSPWNAWSLSVPADNGWKYTYSPPSYGTGKTDLTYTTSDVRQAHSGAITCSATGGTAGDVYGRLFIEAEIEFRDPAPLGGVTNYLSLERLMSAVNDGCDVKTETKTEPARERKDDAEEFDFGDPPPPRGGGMLSSVPGTSAYVPSSTSVTGLRNALSPARK